MPSKTPEPKHGERDDKREPFEFRQDLLATSIKANEHLVACKDCQGETACEKGAELLAAVEVARREAQQNMEVYRIDR